VSGDPSSLPPLRDPAYYRYQLVGVLVHTGTCNSGHYYSYIKDRFSDAGYFGAAHAPAAPSDATPSSASTSTTGAATLAGRWYHFNDTSVEPWNPSEVFDCYSLQPLIDIDMNE
jgi:hypothetical protein